jgi:hypothetical protein
VNARQGWCVFAVSVLAMSGCTTVTDRQAATETAAAAELTGACAGDGGASRMGPPSDCAGEEAPADEGRIERRKRWLTAGIVAVALYFMARAWFEKDPARNLSIPGARPPSDPCENPFSSDRPPWCDPGATYGH